jgi:hypothetical protein
MDFLQFKWVITYNSITYIKIRTKIAHKYLSQELQGGPKKSL